MLRLRLDTDPNATATLVSYRAWQAIAPGTAITAERWEGSTTRLWVGVQEVRIGDSPAAAGRQLLVPLGVTLGLVLLAGGVVLARVVRRARRARA